MKVVFTLTLVIVAVAGLLSALRLVRGPSALDRILALDTIVTMIIAGTAVGIVLRENTAPLPVILVLALLSFIGSITAAHLVEKRQGIR